MLLVLGSKRAGSLGELWEVEWWQWFAEWWQWFAEWSQGFAEWSQGFVEQWLFELFVELPELLLVVVEQTLNGSRQKCISYDTLH